MMLSFLYAHTFILNLLHFYVSCVPLENLKRVTMKPGRHFGVKKLFLAELFLAELFRFYSYKQSKAQSLTGCVVELLMLALTCELE